MWANADAAMAAPQLKEMRLTGFDHEGCFAEAPEIEPGGSSPSVSSDELRRVPQDATTEMPGAAGGYPEVQPEPWEEARQLSQQHGWDGHPAAGSTQAAGGAGWLWNGAMAAAQFVGSTHVAPGAPRGDFHGNRAQQHVLMITITTIDGWLLECPTTMIQPP
jgi:hypothetical protein